MNPKQIEEAIAWLTPFDCDINLTPDHLNAIKTLLSLAQSYLQASEAMPEKRDLPNDGGEVYNKQHAFDLGFNQCHDEFVLWLMKKLADIKCNLLSLRDKERDPFVRYQDSMCSKAYLIDLIVANIRNQIVGANPMSNKTARGVLITLAKSAHHEGKEILEIREKYKFIPITVDQALADLYALLKLPEKKYRLPNKCSFDNALADKGFLNGMNYANRKANAILKTKLEQE